jgi:alkaline phosphatase D
MSADSTTPSPFTMQRRALLAATAGGALALQHSPSAQAAGADQGEVHQATGVRVGEVTPTSAIVWTRLTKHSTRNNKGFVFKGKGTSQEPATVEMPVSEIEGACPGMAGEIRLSYGLQTDLSVKTTTEWQAVTEATDFTHHFQLANLKPDTRYQYVVETRTSERASHAPLKGQFATAPLETAPSNFTFCAMTCQGYPDRGHPDGHDIYPAMLKLQPMFISMTGDVVYYDNDPPGAKSPELARLHWERMFSLPRLVEALRNTATYWLKDDHDTLANDSWPGTKFGRLTFGEGQKIFREQTPMAAGEKGYRTFRWGRDLQIWLTDGRDFRSPNSMKDGPEKTIWGAEQKAWFKKTVKESNATWKILISPTPLVGPDRPNKKDNHANDGYAHEGNELRAWLQANVPENFFVICGDRHWQYYSIHPETKVREFSCGAASNEHAGGTPGENPDYHQFHRVKGGFISVTLKPDGDRSEIAVQHRDVKGEVVHEWKSVR